MTNCSACASMEMWQWSLTLCCCANIVAVAGVRDVLEVVVVAAAVAVDRVAAVVG